LRASGARSSGTFSALPEVTYGADASPAFLVKRATRTQRSLQPPSLPALLLGLVPGLLLGCPACQRADALPAGGSQSAAKTGRSETGDKPAKRDHLVRTVTLTPRRVDEEGLEARNRAEAAMPGVFVVGDQIIVEGQNKLEAGRSVEVVKG